MSVSEKRCKWRKLTIALIFLLPNLLGFLVFTAFPVLLSFFMSFTNWSLKRAVALEWVGLRNYTDLLSDPKFWFYFYNTMFFMLAIPFTVAGSLLLANLLVKDFGKIRKRPKLILSLAVLGGGTVSCLWLFGIGAKDWALFLAVLDIAVFLGIVFGNNAYRSMFYIPSFAAGVATIILWVQIFNPYHGMANNLIKLFYDILGVTGTCPTWLSSAKSLLGFLPLPSVFSNGGFGLGAREAIMIMGFWMGVGGNNMLLYIAAIANIPETLYEAADIDGAGPVAKFLYITLPSVAPTTFFISVMSVIAGLQGGFAYARIMTGGGPAGTTTTLAYYIYTAGFEELRMGYASAVSWVLFAIIFVITLVNWKYGNRQQEVL